MKRSTDRILTTHVGSLIRPPALQEFLRARPRRQALRRDGLSTVPDGLGRRGRAASRPKTGIDVVSDGEFGKSISWSQYALERLSGFERRPIKREAANPFKRGADRTRFAEFYAELDAREGVATTTEAICVGPIKYTGQAELAARHRQLQGRAQGREGRGSVPAGCGAGERDPRPQERILQERRGTAGARSPTRCAPNTR